MQQTKNKAFTLVELIVVITILVILGTIAFISLQGYSKHARNSARISDIKNTEKVLEFFALKTGKYPFPGNSVDVTASGGTVTLWKTGEMNADVQRQVERLSKLPLDPKTGETMKYATTLSRKEYELKYDFELAQNSITTTSYAESTSPYVKGSYNGLYLLADNATYYGVPGLHTSSAILDLAVDFSLNDKILNFQVSPLSYSGVTLNSSNLEANYLNFGLALKTAYEGESELNYGLYLKVTELDDATAENFAKSITSGKTVQSVSEPEEEVVVVVVVVVLPGWRGQDTNCDIDDITIGSQVWAGCNSTLGTGVEWGKQDNGSDGTINLCYDYDGNVVATCAIGDALMASNVKANAWFTGTNTNSDTAVDNIWGKFYSWDNLDTDNDNDIDADDTNLVCGQGYHVPSDAEWEILETTLNGGTNCRNTVDGWLCDGLGWSGYNAKTTGNNLIQALGLPLAGFRNTDGATFSHRGNHAYIWLSTLDGASAYFRSFRWNLSLVLRSTYGKSYGFSVRCIKD
ncbi:prepilin-type N-terminal cleavage/methylation domain-containing protein [Candidatus Gracilibacteria bacterium 28_42_T64]|nr:prepilin-type N-terminal cleavage/methylation domain-containing protein [Candidatus Gracilibacteria bacterium 28_42_T64]